jgi:ribosomal protein S18 acetylase RimI-like enzyme
MGVLAEYRSQGIGQALLETLLSWAQARGGIEKVCLSVHADNQRAISLYKKLGFEVEGIRKRETCFGPGQYADAVLMAKFLI